MALGPTNRASIGSFWVGINWNLDAAAVKAKSRGTSQWHSWNGNSCQINIGRKGVPFTLSNDTLMKHRGGGRVLTA
jgi:hypothetical protein